MEGNSITLKNEDVYQLNVLETAIPYAEGSRLAGQEYHVGRFRGKGFTCTPEFYKEFKTGNIATVTFSPSSYEAQVDDPLEPGKKKTVSREGWALDGYMTVDQFIAHLTKQAKIVELQTNLTVIRTKALKDLELNDEKIAQLQNAV